MKLKTRITYLLVAATLTAAPVLFTTGCAVTQGRQSVGDYTSDRAISSRVKTALLGDPVVKGTQVEVATFNNVVQLSGFVETEAQKQRAGETARLVDGVREVRNDIIVGTPPRQ